MRDIDFKRSTPMRIVTNKGLKFKIHDNDWLLRYVIGVLRHDHVYFFFLLFLFRLAPEEGLCCKPKYWANLL